MYTEQYSMCATAVQGCSAVNMIDGSVKGCQENATVDLRDSPFPMHPCQSQMSAALILQTSPTDSVQQTAVAVTFSIPRYTVSWLLMYVLYCTGLGRPNEELKRNLPQETP